MNLALQTSIRRRSVASVAIPDDPRACAPPDKRPLKLLCAHPAQVALLGAKLHFGGLLPAKLWFSVLAYDVRRGGETIAGFFSTPSHRWMVFIEIGKSHGKSL